MTLQRRYAIGLLVGVFLAAFALRAYRPLSRVPHWTREVNKFNKAIDERDWASTYRRQHPGLTVMAIGGTGLRLYNAVKDTSAAPLMSWVAPSYATRYGQRVAAEIFGLAFVIAGLIVAIALALRRLSGWPLALTAAGLLTFSPFYLAQSRSFNLDALLSTLMLLSGLLLLISLESGQRRYLLLSGLVAGFALLTKTPSVFLVPFTGLALLVHLLAKVRPAWPDHSEGRLRWLAGETGRGLLAPLLLWLLMMALPFALWPAMWVEPRYVIQKMFAGVVRHSFTRGHENRFFAGQIYDKTRLPVVFYPVAMAFESSFITFTLGLVALGLYTLWRRRGRLPLRPLTFWLLVAYAFFFVVQMTLGADQSSRYALPAFLACEVLAAVGLVGLAGLLKQAAAGRGIRLARALPGGLMGLAVGLQALVALPYAPNYGAHHNQLLGGNRVAVKVIEITGQNEGITYAADFLNRQPDAELLRVGTAESTNLTLKQYFSGEHVDNFSSAAHYNIFTVKFPQRNPDKWERMLSIYGESPPEMLVIIDGVEYLRLYATQRPASGETVVIRRGGGLGFVALAWAWMAALGMALVWSMRTGAR